MAQEVIPSLAVKQLTLGAYVGGVATESIGYLVVYDEDGNERKLMVQA